eukprot:8991399-Alexandrium_andersonii.AAC.1
MEGHGARARGLPRVCGCHYWLHAPPHACAFPDVSVAAVDPGAPRVAPHVDRSRHQVRVLRRA